jgi:hypothetical protein
MKRMTDKYIPFEPVTIQVDGQKYTGSYRVDHKRKMMFVEWTGKSESTTGSHYKD